MKSTTANHLFFNHIGVYFLEKRTNLARSLSSLGWRCVFRRPVRQHGSGIAQ